MIQIANAHNVHNTFRTLLVVEGPLTVGRNPFIIPEKKEQVLADSSQHFIYRTEVTFIVNKLLLKASYKIFFSR